MTILAHCTGGLANRIKNMTASFRLDPVVEVHWVNIENYDAQNYHLFKCPYYDLFSFPKLAENLEKGKSYPVYDYDKLLIGPDDGIPENFAQFDNKCDKEYRYTDELNRNIDFEYHRIPENVKVMYSYLFSQIRLNHDVQKRIDNFYNKYMKNIIVVSVHIRSWNRENEEGRQHLHKVDKFIETMMDYKKLHFFVSSDSTEVIEKVKKEVPNVITYNRKTERETSRTNPEALQEDLIELYLLGKGNMLIGSYYSSYSEVAWYLMGCKEVIII